MDMRTPRDTEPVRSKTRAPKNGKLARQMSTAGQRSVCYSLIVPVLNEELVLPSLMDRLDKLLDELDGPAEVLFVDDGSTDASADLIAAKARRDPRFRLISFTRNFGHQVAITAGMDRAAGQAVIVLDADLQDPPELVLAMIDKWREGYQIVYAERIARHGETWLKRWTADIFYRLLRRLASVDIPANVGDFRLVDRRAIDVFRRMSERDPFVRGMFAWMGFRQTAVQYERPPRALGETKYPLHKMISLGLHGVIGFSDVPLRIALWTGFLVSTIAGLLAIYVVLLVIYDYTLVPGWASTMVVVSFLSGINLFMTGIVGLYVGRIHAEAKKRPLYVIAETIGLDRRSADEQPFFDRRAGRARQEPIRAARKRDAAL